MLFINKTEEVRRLEENEKYNSCNNTKGIIQSTCNDIREK